MKLRLNYNGGSKQQDRMVEDKLRTLKKAMLYSYQGATAILADGREFRCLINPDKLKNDYDDKIISIPFKDVCLNAPRAGRTSEGIQPTNIKCGDVFEWKETGTYWIVYLQRLEELAYFRAEIRHCRYEIEINDKPRKVYVRGPVETDIIWNQKKGVVWNDLNYSLVMMLTKDEESEAFFHRFKKIKFQDNTWEVQAIDDISTEGIIEVYLKEYYNNPIEEAAEAEKKEEIPEVVEPEVGSPQIIGENQVYPFDVKTYEIKNCNDGQWLIDDNKIRIVSQNSSSITIEIQRMRSGKFNLSYILEDEIKATLDVSILSL